LLLDFGNFASAELGQQARYRQGQLPDNPAAVDDNNRPFQLPYSVWQTATVTGTRSIIRGQR